MNSDQKHKSNSFNAVSSCDEIVPFLDAYRTDELEEEQQMSVASHLKACSTCQAFLTDIQQLFLLSTRSPLPQQSINEQENAPGSVDPLLVDTIMQEILEQESREQATAGWRINRPFSMRPSRLQIFSWLGAVSAACLLFLVVGLITGSFLPKGQQTQSQPHPPFPWSLQPDQTVITQDQFAFSIEFIEFKGNEIRCFYVTTPLPSSQGAIQMQASSLAPGASPSATELTTYTQSLGTVGKYQAGILYINGFDKVGQIIQLTITLPGHASAPLYLRPLKQSYDSKTSANPGYMIIPRVFSPVQWYGPVRKEWVGFLKSEDGSYLFLRLDSDNVKIITRQEYLRIAGEENFH